ncbi:MULTISPECIES: hypothetical protein [unclassified Duganella]|uniref:hypothetical protein n=1 Tax=unclassified Duganella TaxID=2636909 RepID=UPI000E34133F|nr:MULTISPECIES: hypothetical protein [unclassified Duganella]RFP19631.1 hypothetical protein D0T23_04595 [Duganella sp. BJB475]RFP36664.1 hypothetical protein D0T21_04595 [Duganella sp. BJB476]
MPEALPFPIRKECPPGACECGRDELLEQWDGAPDATDIRILRLTREQEKALIERIENIASFEELGHIEQRMQEQLGIRLTITPSANGVRTVMGLQIRLVEQPGLCRKTRENVPAAVRRCFNKNPDIVYALLNARDLLGAE